MYRVWDLYLKHLHKCSKLNCFSLLKQICWCQIQSFWKVFIAIFVTHLSKTATTVAKGGCSALLPGYLGNRKTHHCHGNSLEKIGAVAQVWVQQWFVDLIMQPCRFPSPSDQKNKIPPAAWSDQDRTSRWSSCFHLQRWRHRKWAPQCHYKRGRKAYNNLAQMFRDKRLLLFIQSCLAESRLKTFSKDFLRCFRFRRVTLCCPLCWLQAKTCPKSSLVPLIVHYVGSSPFSGCLNVKWEYAYPV